MIGQPRPLTVRQTEVLAGVASGWTYQQIADALGMAHSTVREHITRINCKLGTATSPIAALVAARLGYLPLQVESALPSTPNPHPPGSHRRCEHCRRGAA